MNIDCGCVPHEIRSTQKCSANLKRRRERLVNKTTPKGNEKDRQVAETQKTVAERHQVTVGKKTVGVMRTEGQWGGIEKGRILTHRSKRREGHL